MKRIRPENLPDLADRAKALGITLEKAIELVNCIQIEQPERPTFRKSDNPDHHLIKAKGGWWYVNYKLDGIRRRDRLSKDIHEARALRDDIFRELGYIK